MSIAVLPRPSSPRPTRLLGGMAKAALASALMLGLSGCQSGQSAGEVICFAAERAPGVKEADPTTRSAKLAAYVKDNLKHREAEQMWSALASADPASRGKMLKMGLTEIGYTGDCPLVKIWDQTAERAAADDAAAPAAGAAADAGQ